MGFIRRILHPAVASEERDPAEGDGPDRGVLAQVGGIDMAPVRQRRWPPVRFGGAPRVLTRDVQRCRKGQTMCLMAGQAGAFAKRIADASRNSFRKLASCSAGDYMHPASPPKNGRASPKESRLMSDGSAARRFSRGDDPIDFLVAGDNDRLNRPRARAARNDERERQARERRRASRPRPIITMA